MSLFVCFICCFFNLFDLLFFYLAPRPPNADFRLLSSKELSEAEKETSAKPVCTVISLNTSSPKFYKGIRFISGTSILQTTEVSLNGIFF